MGSDESLVIWRLGFLVSRPVKQKAVPDLACEISVGLLEEKLKHMDPESLPPQAQSHQPPGPSQILLHVHTQRYACSWQPCPSNYLSVCVCVWGGEFAL